MSFYADFADYYEAVFPYREAVCDFLSSYLREPTGSEEIGKLVLDIGCGTGHYCGRLAAAGHELVGIDLDPDMVAVAQRVYTEPEFHVLDMADVHTLSPGFDLAFCIGNVAAHLPRELLGEFLGRLGGILTPGGRWIFQVVNWDFILGHESYRFPARSVGDEGVVFQREYRDISPDGLRFLTRLEMPERTVFAGEVTLYPVRAEEYLRLHEAAGFVLEGHFADYQRHDFDATANAANVMVFRRGWGR